MLYSTQYFLDANCTQGTLPGVLEESKITGRDGSQRRWDRYANSPKPEQSEE